MVMEKWRHLAIFTDHTPRIVIWRGMNAKGRVYPLTHERARRLGRLLDDKAIVLTLPSGRLVYVWDDWSWHNIGEYDGDKRTASG